MNNKIDINRLFITADKIYKLMSKYNENCVESENLDFAVFVKQQTNNAHLKVIEQKIKENCRVNDISSLDKDINENNSFIINAGNMVSKLRIENTHIKKEYEDLLHTIATDDKIYDLHDDFFHSEYKSKEEEIRKKNEIIDLWKNIDNIKNIEK